MSEDQKKQLQQQLWNIANTLRGKMDADEFRDYILGFIFYKYLSEKMNLYADKILKEDGLTYLDVDENTEEGKEILEAVKEEAIEQLGYFLKPSELFSVIARRGNGNGKSNFILQDLAQILKHIEQSTMGTDSEDDFNKFRAEEQQKAFDNICKEEKLIPEKLQDVIENYLFTERKPLREDIVKTLEVKPKILERKTIIERVSHRIFDFVETFISGMAS